MFFLLSLLALDVFLDDIVCWRLLSPVPDGDAGATDDLSGFALGVQLAESGPLAQLAVAVHLDQGDAVLLAKSLKWTERGKIL